MRTFKLSDLSIIQSYWASIVLNTLSFLPSDHCSFVFFTSDFLLDVCLSVSPARCSLLLPPSARCQLHLFASPPVVSTCPAARKALAHSERRHRNFHQDLSVLLNLLLQLSISTCLKKKLACQGSVQLNTILN